MVTDADVLKRWKYIAQDDEKLLILIGGPGSGKSSLIRELTFQDGWKICEARELFDDEFLEIPRADRPDKAIALVSAAIHRLNARVVMIDNVEFLFAPILNLDPVAMLKKLSRECPIIVSWRGSLAVWSITPMRRRAARSRGSWPNRRATPASGRRRPSTSCASSPARVAS